MVSMVKIATNHVTGVYLILVIENMVSVQIQLDGWQPGLKCDKGIKQYHW